MKKYDCSKILDYSHERRRMCKACAVCGECPLGPLDIVCTLVNDLTQEAIDIVQKWSDEHPEKPKLTREEHDFLASFMYRDELRIRKGEVRAHLDTHYSECYANATIPLRKDMFQFIDEDKDWTVEELLKLEVEEV